MMCKGKFSVDLKEDDGRAHNTCDSMLGVRSTAQQWSGGNFWARHGALHRPYGVINNTSIVVPLITPQCNSAGHSTMLLCCAAAQ